LAAGPAEPAEGALRPDPTRPPRPDPDAGEPA
jgi:hypothetical protein